jgi:hypothetical protein
MSFFNSLVNQIGREVGRDIYKNVKNAAHNVCKTQLSGNLSLIEDIEKFKISKYTKTTFNNFQLLHNKFISSVNPNCYYFDDVYFAYIELCEKVEASFDIKTGKNMYEIGEETFELIDRHFKKCLELHLEWVDTMILIKESDIAIEKSNIKIYESKGFLGKLLHSKKSEVSIKKIENLNSDIESIKQYISMWNGFKLSF